MRFNDIMEKAEAMDIDTGQMNKLDMIRAIQRAEDQIGCYGTGWVNHCDETPCLWKEDCLELDHFRIKDPYWHITADCIQKALNGF